MRATLLTLTLAATLATTTGCPAEDDEADAGLSTSCAEAATRSDLEFVQTEIFNRSCAAFSSCHRGAAASAADLNLEMGNVELNMVNIDSTLEPGLNMVVPGDPDNSYLLMIMGRTPLPAGITIVNRMPFGNPLLCDEKIEAVARWVSSL